MKYVLAPLAEFTDAPFRRLCHEGGADLTYTEMVSAAALAHGHNPTRQLMEMMPGEGPVGCQIFGAKEDEIALATREASALNRFVEVNLNAGCPMPNVTRCGAGAKLLEDPEKIYRLLKVMSENTDLPVTLKTRVGPHPQRFNALELLDAAEKAGAKGIAIHARFTSQVRGGAVHLDLLQDIVEHAHIPVTGNGSVVDAKTASEMAKAGVSAIMIGRAALANPNIFSQLKNACTPALLRPSAQTPDHANSQILVSRHLSYLLDFHKQLVERFPNDHVRSRDAFVSVKMHTHLFRYFNGRPGAAALRQRLNKVRTLDEIRSIISEMAMSDSSGQV